MKLFAVLILGIALNLSAFAQTIHPIKTILKGDSVVILTSNQFKQLNSTLSVHAKKLKSAQQSIADFKKALAAAEAETARLRAQFSHDTARHSFLFDSVAQARDSRQRVELNAANSKIKLMDDWLLETAVGNAYLYFDWTDSTVRAVDLTMYESQFDHDLGTLSLIRRGPNSEYADFRKRLWQYPESPGQEWPKVNDLELRAIIYPYLHKIRMKNPFLGEFMKNPYVK